MQTGTWSSIGFPIEDKKARDDFYQYANFCYQGGVFISRSSGTVFQANRVVLQIMPILQVLLLAFFIWDAVEHFWYNYWLLVPCFVTGLLGGGVYVNAFTLLAKEVDPSLVEFALSAASIGDSLGIIAADIGGIFLQACLYSVNGIDGAQVSVQCKA